ncbi:hypothetical protein NITHO_280038 [Nitrolancea hollandica Lb]|uniref:Uncharacterized protein n=1 Tax=Nitrolancea hollandica Lb TaxID=1129897 RepID=I4EGT3_9BACT|nr:hypothetical protein NITHO_280038 [Nitrolancea hollandica Lb]
MRPSSSQVHLASFCQRGRFSAARRLSAIICGIPDKLPAYIDLSAWPLAGSPDELSVLHGWGGNGSEQVA